MVGASRETAIKEEEERSQSSLSPPAPDDGPLPRGSIKRRKRERKKAKRPSPRAVVALHPVGVPGWCVSETQVRGTCQGVCLRAPKGKCPPPRGGRHRRPPMARRVRRPTKDFRMIAAGSKVSVPTERPTRAGVNNVAPQGLRPMSPVRPTPGKVASISSVQYAPEMRASAIGPWGRRATMLTPCPATAPSSSVILSASSVYCA